MSKFPNSVAPLLTGSATSTAQFLAEALGAPHAATGTLLVTFAGAVRYSPNVLTTPTGTSGILMQAGDVVEVTPEEFKLARVIRASTESSDVTISAAQYL